MRIAVGGIHTECSTYNPVLMREEDFFALRGAALNAHPYFAFLADYQAEFLPTLHARAIAGGPLTRASYDRFRTEFLERLASLGPLDGLYLAMHGAMFVQGMEDAEGDWICAARAVVGEACPISVSYDLHGNLSPRIVDAIDMFSTYRTAPHIDVEATMRRSVSMLIRSLATGVRPTLLWVPVPVVLPGERTSTVVDPAQRLYAALPAIDAMDGVWDASLMVGYVWADEPRATAAAVMTGTDAAVLEREALALARAYWDAREDFAFDMPTDTIEGCIARALASETHPVIVADSGDNPTGGGVGDRADLLRSLVASGATDTILAGIADRPATEAAYAAGVGARLTLRIGATLDAEGSVPFATTADVLFLHATDDPADRQAVIRIGGVDAVLTAKRRPFHNLIDFARLGLDPAAARIVAVKSGYLSPALAPLADPALMALSPGVVDQDVARLARRRKAVPTYPFDTAFAWTPQVCYSARSRRVGDPKCD
jgi:microcystin degradation protein MlrC